MLLNSEYRWIWIFCVLTEIAAIFCVRTTLLYQWMLKTIARNDNVETAHANTFPVGIIHLKWIATFSLHINESWMIHRIGLKFIWVRFFLQLNGNMLSIVYWISHWSFGSQFSDYSEYYNFLPESNELNKYWNMMQSLK